MELTLRDNRYFAAEPQQNKIAMELYKTVAEAPIVSPHGHVEPGLFVENGSLGTPVDLLIIPDHYLYRMLYSQGIPLERLGIAGRERGGEVESDHRVIWQIFADNFHLFRGTPTGLWINNELYSVFGIRKKLTGETARDIYDEIFVKLKMPQFKPRALFERFNIKVLCTSDFAAGSLDAHKAIKDSGWCGRILPTFRPDDVTDILRDDWENNIRMLSGITGIQIVSYSAFIKALEERRRFFKLMGAVATDHSAQTAFTQKLSPQEADAIFERALKGKASAEDGIRFTGHILMECARMSIEDGLVMQFHPGSLRNHNSYIYDRFGSDKGCDIPIRDEFTKNLKPLLNAYGNDSRFTFIVFTLDESVYSRELAPLAGHYPAMKLGPPWWFHDSVNGMMRYREQICETAGLYNTVGFIDDTRAFLSIPVRHDLSRRIDASWIAGLVVRGIIDMQDGLEMIKDTAYRLAAKAYKLEDVTR